MAPSVNIWKYLFWTLLLTMILTFGSLSYFGIVHFKYIDKVNINAGLKSRRSNVDASDWVKAARGVVESGNDDDDGVGSGEEGRLMQGEGLIMKASGTEEDKGEKKASEKKEKKRVSSETELLQFHSKAVNEIFAPNIEKNLE